MVLSHQAGQRWDGILGLQEVARDFPLPGHLLRDLVRTSTGSGTLASWGLLLHWKVIKITFYFMGHLGDLVH